MEKMSMNSKNDGTETAQKLSVSIQTMSVATLEKLYVLFSKLWTPVQLLLAAGGLTFAFYYGNALRLSLLNTQRSVALALAVKLEPTRNTDQGISAFLLSNVKDEWAKAEHLNIPELNSILQDINTKVREESAKVTLKDMTSGNVSAPDASRALSLNIPALIDELGLEVINTGSTETWRTAITSKRRESFMVVPAMSIRHKTLNELPLVPKDKSRLVAVLEHNPEIPYDLKLVTELAPIMQRMDNASGERLTIIQTYFITESGVFLIRANGVKDQGKYYGDEFQPYTQYMDRPYFWGAVDIKSGQRKVTPFDYGTKPYLDLGGNGFVVTFSKKFELPNHRVGVLCVDAKLPDYTTDEIENYMKSLGAKVSDFYWSADKGIQPGKLGALPSEFSWFDVQLNKSREARSQVLGTIATEPAKTLPAQSQDMTGTVVRFTVPVASGEYGDGIKKTRLLWVEFDSASILKTLVKNLVFFTAGIILVIAVTWSLFWDYTVLKREMSDVLEKMSKVMRDASTPFVWLDEKNEFVKVNKSMLDVLEHENIEELKKQSPTFKGLITDATQQIYDDILAISGAGKETGEYEVDVITKTGKVLHVRAHGERIPYPTWLRRGLPHRFGIFVEVIEPPQTAETESTTGNPNPLTVLNAGA
jgi:PAS domain-containing protein